MPPGRKIPRSPSERPDLPAPPRDAGAPPALRDQLEKAGAELRSLAADIAACNACGRAGDARVLGSGYPRARIMLLKDRPSEADATAGTAFVTEAPQLEKAFERLRIPVSWIWASTALRCGTSRAETDDIRACATHLLVEIEAVQPAIVVAFGDKALDAVRALDGRCGIRAPETIENGALVALRPGLDLLCTEPLPLGLTEPESKRRLWRDLRALAPIAP
jgi:uracil-DNA glycosylase family 4